MEIQEAQLTSNATKGAKRVSNAVNICCSWQKLEEAQGEAGADVQMSIHNIPWPPQSNGEHASPQVQL